MPYEAEKIETPLSYQSLTSNIKGQANLKGYHVSIVMYFLQELYRDILRHIISLIIIQSIYNNIEQLICRDWEGNRANALYSVRNSKLFKPYQQIFDIFSIIYHLIRTVTVRMMFREEVINRAPISVVFIAEGNLPNKNIKPIRLMP